MVRPSRRVAAQEIRDRLTQAVLDLLRGERAAQRQCGETLERGGDRHGEAVDRAFAHLAAALSALDRLRAQGRETLGGRGPSSGTVNSCLWPYIRSGRAAVAVAKAT
ncbi:hypothetical protein ACFV2H_48880 [Streptomyces sp. NPDC059629]|uniref:hypothetical protein n=1 Tax=Streptomyces sp. NPDC059629 TaxID=3346889 RepID=UPI0036C1A315